MSMRTMVTEAELLELINSSLQRRGCNGCHMEALRAVANAGDGRNWRMLAGPVDRCSGKCHAATEALCELLAATYSVEWTGGRLRGPA